jgi:hypothetical protein
VADRAGFPAWTARVIVAAASAGLVANSTSAASRPGCLAGVLGDRPAVLPGQLGEHAVQEGDEPAPGLDPAEPAGHPTEHSSRNADHRPGSMWPAATA